MEDVALKAWIIKEIYTIKKLEESILKQEPLFNKKHLETVQFKIWDLVVVQDTQKAGSGKLGDNVTLKTPK